MKDFLKKLNFLYGYYCNEIATAVDTSFEDWLIEEGFLDVIIMNDLRNIARRMNAIYGSTGKLPKLPTLQEEWFREGEK